MKNKNKLEDGLDLMIQYEKMGGLIPAITQEVKTGEILMLAYANREALEETIRSGFATYWSRSRNELWKKGETSGDMLEIDDILVDCDQDTLIYKVNMLGKGSCHTKDQSGNYRKTCFYRSINNGSLKFKEQYR
jgi:phosphoribosyl-AMP cyclohydrolase